MEDLTHYNPIGSDLRKMQLRMLDMLSFVDKICSKHDIKYWLGAGTLLGAVRHGGFIPWDDDLDIELLKEDYIKLVKILISEANSDYFLQIHDTDPNYIFPIAKLRDINSIIYENNGSDINYKYKGIFIDIFFLEKGSNFLVDTAVHLQKVPYALTLLENDRFGILALLRNLTYSSVHKGLFPCLRILAKMMKGDKQVLPLGTGFRASRNLSDIFPLSKISFEGRVFNAPANPDAYLKKIYGSYMEIPPVDKRRVHTQKVLFLKP